MEICTDDDEIVKLLDVKDIEVIDPSECIDHRADPSNGIDENQTNANSKIISNGTTQANTERRSDEPTELSFEKGGKQFHINCITIRFSFVMEF